MSKFKVGEKVRILEGATGVEQITRKYIGRIATIRTICMSGNEYRLDIDKERFFWKETILRKLKSNEKVNPMFIIVWDEEDRDPHRICFSKEEVMPHLNELHDDSSVIKESIRVFSLNKELFVKHNITLSEKGRDT